MMKMISLQYVLMEILYMAVTALKKNVSPGFFSDEN